MIGLFQNWKDSTVSNAQLTVGSAAPDFALHDENNKIWRLSDYSNQVVALLFYPQNETFVCTRQMCSVRDHWADYLATKAHVVGISPGTVAEHQQFVRKHRVPLPLLADADRSVSKIYGSHEWMPIWWTRAIIVIDGKGIVRSRTIMFRALRPTDFKVISEIYRAKTDGYLERQKIIEQMSQNRLKDKAKN